MRRFIYISARAILLCVRRLAHRSTPFSQHYHFPFDSLSPHIVVRPYCLCMPPVKPMERMAAKQPGVMKMSSINRKCLYQQTEVVESRMPCPEYVKCRWRMVSVWLANKTSCCKRIKVVWCWVPTIWSRTDYDIIKYHIINLAPVCIVHIWVRVNGQ